MSKTKLVTLICWIVVAVALIGLVVWFLSGNLFGFRTGSNFLPTFHIGSFESLTGPFNVAGTYEANASEVTSIDVNWVAGSATVTPYDGNTVKVTELAQRDLSDSEKFVCSVSGGILEIKYCAPGMNLINVTKKLEVLVPKTLADKLDVLDINATSAEVTVSDFSANTFNVSETSGDADISNINADTSKVHSVSGEITIENMTVTEIDLNTVSGEIRLTGVTADNVKSNTTSGGQEFNGTFKDVDADSVSGEISVTSNVDPDRMKIHTTSGGITITFPGNKDLTVSYSTVSGRFNSEIPVRTGDSGDYNFSSVSGNINLKAA